MDLVSSCLLDGNRIALAALKDAEWPNMACRYKLTNLQNRDNLTNTFLKWEQYM